MYKRIIILFILLSYFVLAVNAQYSPYFKNYSIADYDAGNQNWGLSKSDNSKLFVANNEGLLSFDGIKWILTEMPNKTTVRSVLQKDDRVYVGSYEEFGFWQKDNKGTLIYYSLSNQIKDHSFVDEEFWQITAWGDAIVFRSFLSIYIYKNGKIDIVHTPSTTISCHVINNQFYIATLNDGIFNLDGNKLVPIVSSNLLKEKKVVFMTEYLNDKFLIGTALQGCFIYDNGSLLPWQAPVNKMLKEFQLNTFSKNDDFFIFGTIQNGLYLTHKNGQINYQLNKENGLLNNTILGQVLTDTGELWLGLNSGIAQINLSSGLVFYNDSSSKLGAVYDIVEYKKTIYIGSNTGLYFLDKQHKVQFIDGSQGQVWDLKIIDDKLFCGHNNGTFLVENKRLKLISPFVGGWVMKKVPEQQNIYIQGTYVGLVRYKKNADSWEVTHLGKTTKPFRFLVFENQTTAWVAHAYKGLYRVQFDKNYDSIIKIQNYGNKGLSSDYNVRVFKIRNNICFKTNGGWQKYEAIKDSIINAPLLNDEFGSDAYIISQNNEDLFVLKNEHTIEFKSIVDSLNFTIIDKYFKNRLVVGYENIVNLNDKKFALTLNDGYLIIDKFKNSKKRPLKKPIVSKFILNNEIIPPDSISITEFKYKSNVLIDFTIAGTSNHYFEYSLEVEDKINWKKIEKERLKLYNLSEGFYKLLIRTNNNYNEPSAGITIQFEVSPPWFRSKTGFILYIFIALLIGLIFYFLHKRKVAKEQRLLQLDLENKQAIILKEKSIENEKKLVSIRNEALKNEIKLKSKQLANNAMSLVKKNETLTNLKREFALNRNSIDAQLYQKLLKKIDGSLGHKGEWKIFEHNFNQVHEDFFNQLKKQFPKLTHKDLKLCAYIKMNIPTKEIAPLMNISDRGVETHRYRLKKKLNLDKKDLQIFLKNFN